MRAGAAQRTTLPPCHPPTLSVLRMYLHFHFLESKSWIINNQDHVGKHLSKDNSLEVYVAISQKNLSCKIFDKKNHKKKNERKSWELTVCHLVISVWEPWPCGRCTSSGWRTPWTRCIEMRRSVLLLYIYTWGLLKDLSSPSASKTQGTLSNNQSTMLKLMVRKSGLKISKVKPKSRKLVR